MTAAPRARPGPFDLTETTWRGRAVRYVVIYLALTAALVTARALTWEIRKDLRNAQNQEAALLSKRNDLAVQVQILENPQRIRDWAFANDMIRFAEAPKETRPILPPPAAPNAAAPSNATAPPNAAGQAAPPGASVSPAPETQPDNTVEVNTQWK